jgi:hypothetical protein
MKAQTEQEIREKWANRKSDPKYGAPTETKHTTQEVWQRNRIALAQLMRLIEGGVLVRNVHNDGDIVQYMRDSTTLALALKQAQDALELEIQ